MDRPLLILDGGMGHLLMEKGVGGGPNKKKLFAGGGLANLNEPKVVISLHESFIEAGADVITTNNFGLTPASLEASGLGESLSQYIEAAGLVAWEAAHTKHGAVLVAGCLPPLTLAYANIDVREAELHQPIYNQIVEALLPNVDLFLCETMATEAQTWAAASAASASGKPFWISWTLADQEGPPVLRGSGEPLEHAIKRMCTFPGLHALLLNCCAPQVISTALQVMRKATPPHIRIGAYPNGFKTSTSEWLSEGHTSGVLAPPEDYDENGMLTPQAAGKHAVQWVRAGASIVGGCCGLGPPHIQAISKAVKAL
eukprot:jgi/Botrbrau1/18310/Bobra.0179s0039.1